MFLIGKRFQHESCQQRQTFQLEINISSTLLGESKFDSFIQSGFVSTPGDSAEAVVDGQAHGSAWVPVLVFYMLKSLAKDQHSLSRSPILESCCEPPPKIR